MSERRVVITGIGVVSPVGNNKEDFWKNILAGKSGIRRIQSMDTEKLRLQDRRRGRGL